MNSNLQKALSNIQIMLGVGSISSGGGGGDLKPFKLFVQEPLLWQLILPSHNESNAITCGGGVCLDGLIYYSPVKEVWFFMDLQNPTLYSKTKINCKIKAVPHNT